MKKYFTARQANSALQLVRPIVQDILTKMDEAQRLHEEVKIEKKRAELHETALLSKLNRAEELLNKIEYHMEELNSIGVMLKDLERGCVDFPCIYNNRVIYLCWTLGESAVVFWHEENESTMQRKQIDASFLLEPKILV